MEIKNVSNPINLNGKNQINIGSPPHNNINPNNIYNSPPQKLNAQYINNIPNQEMINHN